MQYIVILCIFLLSITSFAMEEQYTTAQGMVAKYQVLGQLIQKSTENFDNTDYNTVVPVVTGVLAQNELINAIKKPFPCRECPKGYVSANRLNEHVLTEHRGERFFCGSCPKKPMSWEKYSRHMQNRHVESEKSLSSSSSILFQCFQCGKKLSDRCALENHRYNKHDETRKKYVCDDCGKEYKRKKSFDDHILAVHMGLFHYCNTPGCTARYVNLCNLVLHQKKHLLETNKSEEAMEVSNPT